MTFLTDDDLATVLRDQILLNLLEDDPGAKDRAEKEAVEKMKTYLRNRFDVATVFSQTGNNRNMLMVEHCVNLTVFRLHCRVNPLRVPIHIQEGKNEAMNFLIDVQDGKAHPDLPLVLDPDTGDDTGRQNLPWGSGTEAADHYF